MTLSFASSRHPVKTMNINLHIERLILDGIDLAPLQRHQLRAAVENELTRLLSEGAFRTHAHAGAIPSIISNTVELNQNPTHFGKQIAGSVYGGIAK